MTASAVSSAPGGSSWWTVMAEPRFGFGSGQNQFSPRLLGSPVHVTFDSAQMGAMARRVAGMAARADKPIIKAHSDIANELQGYIAGALGVAVGRRHGRGMRAQRKKPENQRLVNAIMSPRNRRVNVDGFTVGYLDNIAAVRPYWRGLEVGTRKHIGNFVPGIFIRGGKAQPLTPDGRDLVMVGPSARRIARSSYQEVRTAYKAAAAEKGRKRIPKVGISFGFRIKNPIIGYHYFDTGIRSFVQQGWTRDEALVQYASELRRAGLAELADTLGRNVAFRRRSAGLNTGPLAREIEG